MIRERSYCTVDEIILQKFDFSRCMISRVFQSVSDKFTDDRKILPTDIFKPCSFKVLHCSYWLSFSYSDQAGNLVLTYTNLSDVLSLEPGGILEYIVLKAFFRVGLGSTVIKLGK